jgi:hypothetical protein
MVSQAMHVTFVFLVTYSKLLYPSESVHFPLVNRTTQVLRFDMVVAFSCAIIVEMLEGTLDADFF